MRESTPMSSAEASAVGVIRTSAAKSPDFGINVAIGMVRMTHWDEGTTVEVHTQDGPRAATVHEHFWL